MIEKIDNKIKRKYNHHPKRGGIVLILMVFQKANGQIIKRKRNTLSPYRVGDTTSMGWKVIDILYLFNHKYYPKYEYDRMVKKDFLKRRKIENIKKWFTLFYKRIVSALVLLILFRTYILINRIF